MNKKATTTKNKTSKQKKTKNTTPSEQFQAARAI
jgi:hypothetical protein